MLWLGKGKARGDHRILKGVDELSLRKEDCEFCSIVQKEMPASIVFEDDETIAFLDIKPINDGHTLVIPKKHCETIYELPDDEIACLFRTVRNIALAIKSGVGADGITILQRNGKAAHQHVFHVHVHVIPRYEGQKLAHSKGVGEASRERLDEIAKKLKQSVLT